MEKQPLVLTFAGGIDTKTDEFLVQPTKFSVLQNGVQTQTGQLAKRWGYRALGRGILGTASVIASCLAINACNNELLLYDGQNCYSYSQANDAWVSRGGAVSVIETNKQIIRNSSQQLSPDFATLGGIDVYAWEDSRGGIRYSVLDSATGAYLVTDQPLYTSMASTIVRPKVLAFPGANLVVILFATATGQLGFVTVSPSNPTRGSTVYSTILGGLLVNGPYDAQVSQDGLRLVIAYKAVISGLLSVLASSFSTTFVNQWTTNIGGASLNQLAMSVAMDPSGNAWVVNPINASSQAAALNPSGTILFGPTTTNTVGQKIQSIASIYDATLGALRIFIDQLDPSGGANVQNEIIFYQTITIGGVVGFPVGSLPTLLRGVGLASKPFVANGRIYVNVASQSTLQSTYFTVDQTGQIIAKINPGNGGGLIQSSDFMLSECPPLRTGVFKFANLVKGGPVAVNGTLVALLGVNSTTLDFADSDGFLSCFIDGGFYTVGGVTSSYDGAQYVEHGFHLYPENVVATPAGAGGSMATGTYNYVVTYEWVDNNGLRQISTPSVALSVAVTGPTGQVTLTIPTLRLTKKSRVQIVVYRTAANGTLLYQVTSPLVPLYNDPTVDTATLVDTLADASITSNALLYTQPLASAANGANPILPNAAPPSASLICAYADRVFLSGLDNPYQLEYSKQVTANVPIEFAGLRLNVDPDGGPITGIARLDDKLIVFKRYAIFYLVGQGPDATGSNSDFGDLVQIPSGGVGAVNALSIVTTPIGIMFNSGNGIYLVDRGLNVSYKGAPAQAYNGLTITSGQLIPNQWVVFTTTADTAIVYDYYYDQWSTFTNHAAIDAALFLGEGNLYAFARTNGQVMLQQPGVFNDAGAAIPLGFTTAWINPGVLQGYQRVYFAYILGTYQGSHTLNVGVGTNYNESVRYLAPIAVDQALGSSTFGSSTPFGIDALFGGSNGDPDQYVYEFRVDVIQKCSAIRFQIAETEVVPNQAMSLSAITLMLGVKRGGMKLPAVKQIGAV